MIPLGAVSPHIFRPSLINLMNPGLYIHIPFCISKCGYCDFYSVTQRDKLPYFIKALLTEIELYRDLFNTFDTIYFGGGTPSLLEAVDVENILNGIYNALKVKDDPEITIEVNPGDLTLRKACQLQGAGINRINIGVQSFDSQALSLLGRRHNIAEALSAIESARNAGFKNLGIDLIYGIPGQSIKKWLETLRSAISFSPQHLSCYQLTIEPSTPLADSYLKGEIVPHDDDILYDFFMQTSETLEAAGYIHYEVSNFSQGPEWVSQHNRKYWNHTPYLGLGPAAHSFIAPRRWWNHGNLDRYITDTARNIPPVGGSEILTGEQLGMEARYLGLRTSEGIDIQAFAKRYGPELLDFEDQLMKKMIEENLLAVSKDNIRLTRKGLALSDSISMIKL